MSWTIKHVNFNLPQLIQWGVIIVPMKMTTNEGIKTLYIELGSPWQNGFIESFNGRLRDECLNREVFYTLTEARVVCKAAPLDLERL